MSEFPRSYFLEGYTFFKQRNFAPAAVAFRRFADDASEKDQTLKADALLRAADAYFLTGGYLVAAGLYDDAAAGTSPDADYALFQAALCKGLVRKNEDKVQRLKKLLSKYPQSRLAPEARFELGNTYLEMNKFDLALEAFQVLESTPGNRFEASAKVKKGLIYRNQQKYDQALALFKGVVAQYPGTSEANEAQAFAKLTYLNMGQAEAYATWVESLGLADAKRGELDTLLFTSAFESFLQGDFTAAAKGFEQYQSRFKTGQYIQKSQFYLAESYFQLNNPRAEALYAEIAALPGNEYSITTWERLADIRYAKKDYPGAYQAFGKLLELADSRQRELKARVGLLECAFQLALDEEVVNVADALQTTPGITAEQLLRGQMLKARSLERLRWEPQATTAWEGLRKASNPAYQAEARYRLLERLYGAQSYSKAIDDGFALIEQLPGQGEWKNKALMLMARCYEGLNDLFQANYTLDFLINNNPSSAIAQEAQQLKAEMQAREAEKKAALEAQKDLQKLVLPLEQLNEPGMDDENETP
jgi:TolA-binding protein